MWMKLWTRYLLSHKRRQDYKELISMTDNELKDIGISRCDIRSAMSTSYSH